MCDIGQDEVKWQVYQNCLKVQGYKFFKEFCVQERTADATFVHSLLFARILDDVVKQLYVDRHPICHALPKENNKRAGWLLPHVARVYYQVPFARSVHLCQFRKLLGFLKQLARKDAYDGADAYADAVDANAYDGLNAYAYDGAYDGLNAVDANAVDANANDGAYDGAYAVDLETELEIIELDNSLIENTKQKKGWFSWLWS